MPKKTKIIFIIVFILVGAIMLGLYFYFNKQKPTTPNTVGNIAQKFNPFGGSKTVTPTPDNLTENPTENPNTTLGSISTSRFHQVTNFAVSGAVYFDEIKPLPKKEGAVETPIVNQITPQKGVKTAVLPKPAPEPLFELVPSLRYVERATGHVYQMYIDGWIEGKIANSTIPGVEEAIFDSKAVSIIYRYLSPDNKSISSFIAQLGGTSGSFLNSNIMDISLSLGKDKYFSLTKNKNGIVGTIKSFGDTKSSQVFTSPFTEWLPQWVTDKNIYLTTKPSYSVEGSVFSLNISNGVLTKVFGGIPGLTTLANSDGSSFLFGSSLTTIPTLNVFDVKTHTSMDLDKYGLPEKCIWSNDKINVYCAVPNTIVGVQYPDVWYQGLVSFSDSFIQINTVTKETSTMANSERETPVDAIKMFLNKDESKLFFINKKDGTLWSFQLK